jgi:hypothetical protein
MLRAYSSSVGRPSAQGVGEFLFATGIIPSDTDFRIFRDFGGIQGTLPPTVDANPLIIKRGLKLVLV